MSSTVDMWMVTFRGYIPIIPEKAPGKLAGSFGLGFSAFTGQDVRTVLIIHQPNRPSMLTTGPIVRGPGWSMSPITTAPVVTGGWAQLVFYWTDTIWSGFYYGQIKADLSQFRKNQVSTSAVERQQEYIVNLVYDPNPAVRLGLEYAITPHTSGGTSIRTSRAKEA